MAEISWQCPLPYPEPRIIGDFIDKSLSDTNFRSKQRTYSQGLSPASTGGAHVGNQSIKGKAVALDHELGKKIGVDYTKAVSTKAAESLLVSKSAESLLVSKSISKLGLVVGQDEKVLIGPGRWFRPTPWLVSLFFHGWHTKEKSYRILQAAASISMPLKGFSKFLWH